MFVIHVIVGLNVGGAELTLKRLIDVQQHILDNKHEVISLTDIGDVGLQLKSLGINVQSLGMITLLDIPKVVWKLKGIIQIKNPDIVQTWMYHSDLLGGVAAFFAGHRHIVWGIRTTFLSKRAVATILIRQLCALLSYWLPQKIICVAESAKRSHVLLGYDSSRMVVISNGFEVEKFGSSRDLNNELYKSYDFSEHDLVIGCVGRFHQDKGQDLLIEAAVTIVLQYPKTKFLLVGRGCDSANALLVELLEKFRLRDNFILIGERNDIPDCLTLMDIYCMPSRTEGFPNGLGEAMAAGLPCVASDVGDASILVGETAILTEPYNQDALAMALLTVITMTDERRIAMGLKGKERVRNTFSISSACQQFDVAYQQILQK